MGYEACPEPKEACPFYYEEPPEVLADTQEHGCRSDSDHIIPRRMGTTAIKQWWIERKENQEQICRWEHIKRNKEHQQGNEDDIPPFPPREEMVRDLEESARSGEFHMSSRKKRILYGE